MEPPRRPTGQRASRHLPITNSTPSRTFEHLPSAPICTFGDDFTQETKTLEKIGLDWHESASAFEVEAECIETKTITTTTTTKRAYPPVTIRPSKPLEHLDTREYPLALKPTPQELRQFSYMVGETSTHSSRGARLAKENALPNSPFTTKNENENAHSRVQLQRVQMPSTAKTSKQIRRHHESLSEVPHSLFSHPPRSPESLALHPSKVTSSADPSADRRGARPSYRQFRHATTQNGSSRISELYPPEADAFNQTGDNSASLSFMTSASDESYEEAPSPSLLAAHNAFPSAVATPPIAENDLEPFEQLTQALAAASPTRLTLNTSAIQNASLPSPSLSPTMAAAKLHDANLHAYDEDDTEGTADSQDVEEDAMVLRNVGRSFAQDPRSLVDIQSMLDTFDGMPDDMKSFVMYQFLKRCSRKTLHLVSDVVNPALKCDFLDELPPELRLHILSFLDVRDLCRAAQVSKRWRDIIDGNEAGWKDLIDRDRLALPEGELDRAITQGWGWQDDFGLDAYEHDLSQEQQPDPADSYTSKSGGETSHLTRSSVKRKRTAGNHGREHGKRHKEVAGAINESRYTHMSRSSKGSEGAYGASTAAVLAVPNPNVGLPSLQKMHLYKSLYRRHYMLQKNWMNSQMQPHHMAFPAHPRHVITCLQFDDDKIITGSDDTFIHVYDTKTGKLRQRLVGHDGGVWALQYEGNVLVSGSTDRSVRVWDIEKGVCTQVFGGHTSTVRCLQIVMPVATGKMVKGRPQMVPEKPLIITGSRDSQLRVWKLPEQGAKRFLPNGPAGSDVDCPYFVRVLTGHAHSVRAIAAYSDTLVSGSYDNSVRVWKISTGETVHVLRGHSQKVYSVVLDMGRGRCISGSMDTMVKIWSLETGACLYTLDGHSSLVGLLDLKDDRLVSAAADSTLRIWDPETGSCKSTLTAHTGAITCFQHDGTKVISGSDRTLKMWDVKTGECLQDLLTDLTGVWQVRFDERRCIAAVQREGNTYLEVLDFGASRDGIPASERGHRILLPASDHDTIPIDEDVLDN